VYRDGLREIVLERPFAGPSADHFTFTFDIGKRLEIITQFNKRKNAKF
jgi:hypothetical protein